MSPFYTIFVVGIWVGIGIATLVWFVISKRKEKGIGRRNIRDV